MRLRLSALLIALGLGASVSHALAEPHETPSVAPAAAADAPPAGDYAKLYQAPLFVSMFAVAAKEAPVDETALRYYASQRNTQRVDAEIRRLKALHPNWQPPSNVYAPAGTGNDEQPFWDLFAADRMNELRAGIALREKREQGWKPSRELEDKIRRKEAAAALVAAENAGSWSEALKIADDEPAILNCSAIDTDWRVAEAFLKIDRSARAFEIYQAILTSCTDYSERLTTVRKAIARFPVDDVKRLIAMGGKMQDGSREFDPVSVDLTRARLNAINAGQSKETIEPADLEEFFAAAEHGGDRADFSLAGWYEYRGGRWASADKWFALGAPPNPDADEFNGRFVLGHGLSLLKLGKVDQARRLAWAWRANSDALRDLYVSAALAELAQAGDGPGMSDADIADFAQLVREQKSFEGASALGWRRLRDRRWDESALWFKQALAFKGVDPMGDPGASTADAAVLKAVEGEVLALNGGDRLDEAADVAEIWRQKSPALAKSFIDVVTTLLNGKDHSQALTPHRIHAFADLAMAQRSEAAAKGLGWYNYRAQDWTAAADWFSSAVDWSEDRRGDAKTNQGLALALKNAGRLAEAEEIAWTWRDSSADLRSVYLATMVAELTAPPSDASKIVVSRSRVERFAGLVVSDRSSEGAKALGWHALAEANCAYAAPWFKRALAWSADGAEDAKTSEGLAQSFRTVGRYAEAENIAYALRDHAPELRDLYLAVTVQELTQEFPAVAISEPRLARFSAFVLERRSVDGAQALAWRRYRQAGEGYGAHWFQLAALWSEDKPRDAKLDEGYALALRAVARLPEAEALATPWVDKNEAMKKLYVDIMVEQMSRDNPPEPVDEGRLTSFIGVVEPMRSAFAAQGLGWYRLERGEYRDAAAWFEHAVQWWPNLRNGETKHLSAPVDDYQPILAKLALLHPDYRRTPRAYPNSSALIGKSRELYVETFEGREKTWEGYALALRQSGRVDEAEKIAFAHRQSWPPLRKLSIDIAIAALAREDGAPLAEERLQRYRDAIVEDRASAGAEALGWRAYRGNDYAGAAQWMQTSLDWLGNDAAAKPKIEVIEVLTKSLHALKRDTAAIEIATKYRGAGPGFVRVYFDVAFAVLQNLPTDGPDVAAKFAEIQKQIDADRSVEGATSAGWYLYRLKDYPGAVQRFRDAVAWRSQPAAEAPLEGLALALCAQTGQDEYCSFAYSWRNASSDLKTVYADAMMSWLAKAAPEAEMPASALANFQSFVTDEKSAPGARALGWRKARSQDWPGALKWFRSALTWDNVDLQAPESKTNGDGAEKTVEGYAQALRNSGDVVGAENVAYVWRQRSSELRALYYQSAVQALNAEPKPMDDPRVVRFAAETQNDRSLYGAQNLGWLAYRDKDFAAAVAWFERGLNWAPDGEADVKTYEGYALSLLAAGRLADAEDVAWKWRGKSKELRAVFINVMVEELAKPELAGKIDSVRVNRMVRVTLADRSAAGAQAIAWWKFADEHCANALPWFQRAIAWSADGKGDPKANEGLALALDRLGRSHEAEDVAYGWAERSPAMRAIYFKIGATELTREWPAVDMDEARIARYRSLAQADRSSVAMQAVAWRRYRQAGEGYGGRWFELARAWSSDGKGDAKLNEGLALAMRAVGRNAVAEDIVYPWVGQYPAMKKLYVDIGVEELSRDNPPEPMEEARIARYVGVIGPMQSALGAQALAWYRYERGENAAAVQWFKSALDWWPKPKDDGDKKLLVPVDDYQPILAKLALLHADYRRTPRAFPNSSLLIGQDSQSYVDTPEGLAKTVQGYVLALRATGRLEEAETLAYSWQDRWPPLRALFLEIAAAELAKDGAPLSADRLSRYVEVIAGAKSSPGAAALAWRSYRAQNYDDASKWFAFAIDWRDANTQPDLDLVQGAAMALRFGKHLDQAAALVAQWRGALPALRDASIQIALDQLAGLDPNSPEAAKAIAVLAADVGAEHSADGASAIGWLAYQRKELPAAEAWFKKAVLWADKGAPDAKALEGLARTLVAEGRVQDAFTFADQWSQRVPALKPIFIEIATAALASPPENAPELSDDAIARAGAAFAQAQSADGAQALAWARIRVKDYATAIDWFKAATLWANGGDADAKTAEGMLIALRGLNRLDEAETLAYSWARRDEGLRTVYLEIVADRLSRTPPSPPNAEGMRRFADMTLQANSAPSAEALGWYSYNTRQIQPAASWFEKALAWAPDESAALGAALSFKAMADRQNYMRILGLYRLQYGKIADLAAGRPLRRDDGLEQRAVLETPRGGDWTLPAAGDGLGDDDAAAPARKVHRQPKASGALGAYLKRKDYASCIAKANALAQSGALKAADAVIEGWCLLNTGRPSEAARVFDFALSSSSTGQVRSDAAYGKSLALLNSGRPVDAVAAAGSGDLTAQRRNDIGLTVLAQRANDAYTMKRYAETIHWLDRRKAFAPETRDLMQLRAWALYQLGEKAQSAELFKTLDTQLSTPDTAGGLDISTRSP